MKIFLALSAALLGIVSAEEDLPYEDNVVALTNDNFESTVLGNPHNTIVKFYAPWCGHCKAMRPAWASIANHFSKNPSVVIAVPNDIISSTHVCLKTLACL